MGDEAVLDVGAFTLDGRPMRGVRQAVRPGRAGRVHRDGAPGRAISRRPSWPSWRRGRPGAAARSSAGSPWRCRGSATRPTRDCVVATARRATATLRGLLHFVPWGPDGLSLDLMRRDRTPDNGLNEFLVAELVAAARALGVRRLSLNFAVFRSALERGRAHRRRSGRAGLALAAVCRLALVADRDASTGSTPSSSRSGSRGSSASPRPGSCPASPWPPWRPRRSWSDRARWATGSAARPARNRPGPADQPPNDAPTGALSGPGARGRFPRKVKLTGGSPPWVAAGSGPCCSPRR